MKNEDVNPYEVRSRLLMDAMNYVGVCQPEEAALVWAEGLKLRNAAIQYSVMSDELRKEYASQLEKSSPNWVTGVSSPWVDAYEITEVEDSTDNQKIIYMRIYTATSAGPYDFYEVILTVERQGKFWKVVRITGHEELQVYLGISLASKS